MLDETTNISRAEARVNRSRDDLSSSIAALKQKLDTAALLTLAAAPMARGAGQVAKAAGKQVIQNPLATALIVGGIAWMIAGQRKPAKAAGAGSAPLAGTSYEALSRWEDEGGPPPAEPHIEAVEDVADDWLVDAKRLRTRLSDGLSTLDRAARAALAPTKDLAADKAALVANYSADVKAALSKGLHDLPAAAQERMIAAREAAFAATDASQQAVAKTMDSHPLTFLGAAMALGAAVAAFLPSGRQDDATAKRDALLAKVRKLSADERDALSDKLAKATKR